MAGAGPHSRVLTLVFTDLADSTALKSARGDDAGGALIARHREHVARLAREHAGRVVDFAGDGAFLAFEAPSAAALFALELQAVHASERELPGVRVGIHLGEVSERDGRVEGLAVDLAARVQSLAAPGQVLLSAAAAGSARQRIPHELSGRAVRWASHGAYALKGANEPLEVFEAGLDGIAPFAAPRAGEKARPARRPIPRAAALLLGGALLASAGGAWWLGARTASPDPFAPTTPASAPALTPIRSLAVLPLANLSGDPEQEYFADGMTETLIAELAKLPGVRVISRTSVMQFKRTSTPLPEIAKQLNVDGVIEGSVMRAGDEVRITAQLVDARSDQHVWAEQYDRELARVLEIQSEVARAIATQIALALTPEQEARLRAPKPVDPRAQEAYFRSLGFQTYEVTLGALSEATAIDPEFARAHAALAKTYSTVAIYQPTLVPDAASKARQSALRAISLDDSLADSHEALGRIAFYFDWDWATAERELRRALELAHGISTARADLADLLLATGRRSEAFEESRLFVEESQGESRARSQRAMLLKLAGDYEGAIAEAEAALARDPRNYMAAFRIAEANVLLGRTVESINANRRILEIPGDGFRRASAAESERALKSGGIKAHWRGLRDNAIRDARPVPEAEARAQLGEIDEAIAALERGYRERNPQMRHLISRHGLSPLHSDPRFADLARRMNLPLPKP